MTLDEKAARNAAIEYNKAIDKYGLDDIEDGWGQDHKRYMNDAFYAGFYRGRDFHRELLRKIGFEISANQIFPAEED